MGIASRPKPEIILRATVFCLACTLVGVAAHFLGFIVLAQAVAIAGLCALLAAVTTELPWGGFFFPSDALVFSICLIAARYDAVVIGFGAALASATMTSRWGRVTVTAGLRNVLACAATVAVWRGTAGSEVLAFYQGLPVPATYGEWIFSLRAVPPLLLAAVVFLGTASAVELGFRTSRGFSAREFMFLNFTKHIHHLGFTLLIGAIVAAAYVDMGLLAFILFAFPLLLTRDALERNLDLRRSRVEALRALSSSVDARDRYTFDHSSRVSRLAALLAREMGFSEATVEMIESGALLHDIGKISLDVEILSKPGPLDAQERLEVRQHPMRSAQVVSSVELFKGAVDIVRHHHERPDGQGYPDGLKADEIPLGARILNVADAFDAMTSDRPYRKRRSVNEALDELRKGSGTEFDPVVVEYLVRLLRNRADEVPSLSAW